MDWFGWRNAYHTDERVVVVQANHSCGDLNEARYPPNTIKTSKYTLLTFLPLNLWEQLHKAANVYFLVISLIMFLGNYTDLFVGTIKFYSTFLALSVMMLASAVMAALDDVRRHAADAQTNSQIAVVVRADASGRAHIGSLRWAEVVVGDILLVRGEDEFPADLIPLAASGDEGGCYVSTANLDGETNLKIKTAATCTQKALCGGRAETSGEAVAAGGGSGDLQRGILLNQAVDRLGCVNITVHAEAVQKSIHTFAGSIRLGDAADEPLGQRQLLLRGTVLRNTAWCLGLVIYTGTQTRMVMNSRKTRPKIANLERVINASLLVVVGSQCLLALVSDVLFVVTKQGYLGYWYLYPDGKTRNLILPDIFAYWLTFFVLYSNLMPISLYFTMEVCNLAQAYYIKNDLEMYDEDQECPANARSTNLGHELGQVSYVFTDKTGTLTQNVMELKRVSIAGEVYGELDEVPGFQGGRALAAAKRRDPRQAAAIDAFLEVLSVSHTVMLTRDQSGQRRYEAESPDEGALVEAVADLGWAFAGRSGQTLEVEVGDDRVLTYRLLALNAFTSKRKRQSVVVQRPSGERVLLVKGADERMLERAEQPELFPQVHLTAFAREGLRTLVLGRRLLGEAEFLAWYQTYSQAQAAMGNREELLEAAAEQIETRIEVVGVTAIEDKLQVGVQSTIVSIREAGVRLWVLTGDKLETARNIGFSTKVLSEEMEILVLDWAAGGGEDSQFKEALVALEQSAHEALLAGRVLALMVTGQALNRITAQVEGSEEPEPNVAKRRSGRRKRLEVYEKRFLELTTHCSVVIACRVSPSQKAEMVKLVRTHVKPSPVTLAIGDGANDVPMIQQAQVGVGISGREGRQAVNSADFSIAQFRFLQRLMLVHGRWNYRRACKFVLYSFWKNAVLVLLMFYYTFRSGFAGTSLFEDMVRASYNFILAFPIIATGIFDRDVDASTSIHLPGLYEAGRLGLGLNPTKLVEMMLSAVVHSTILSCVMGLAYPAFRYGNVGDYYTFGTSVFTCLVIAMNYRAAFVTSTWNWLTLVAQASSFLLYALFLAVYCMSKPMSDKFEPWMYMVPARMLGSMLFWICAITVPALAMVVDAFKAYLVTEFLPDPGQLVLERAHALGLGPPPPPEGDGTGSAPLIGTGLSSVSFSLLRRAETYPATLAAGITDSPARQARSAPALGPRRPFSSDKSIASSFDFAHPGGEPRDLQTLRALDPTAGDTSLADRVASPFARSRQRHRTNSQSFRIPSLAEELSPLGDHGSGRADTSAVAKVTASLARDGSNGDEENPEPGGPQAEHPRVDVSDFAQQRIRNLQLETSWRRVLVAEVVVGAMLILAGLLLLCLHTGVAETIVTYEGAPGKGPAEIHCPCAAGAGGDSRSCTCKVHVAMDMKAPISIYYELDPFFQNYPEYLASGSEGAWKELTGRSSPRATHCRGANRGPHGEALYPCGLQATSLFNDTFELFEPPAAVSSAPFLIPTLNLDLPGLPGSAAAAMGAPYEIETKGVAWASDLDRFRNPSGYSDQHGISWLYQRYPSIVTKEQGVVNEHFAAWMRPEAFPLLMKSYGCLSKSLRAGQEVILRINSSFPLVDGPRIKASKRLILTTASTPVAHCSGLGKLLLFSGGACWVMAFAVAAITVRCRRRPGEVRRCSTGGEERDDDDSSSSSEEDDDEDDR